MPKQEVYQIRPTGWENDPEEERRKVSTLDYLTACVYTNYSIFFRLDDDKKELAVSLLKEGLQRTITQIRHVIGTIEKDEKGGHSFVKKRDSAVEFHVQWLDSPEDKDKYPSFDDLEKNNFTSVALGDIRLWSVDPMTYGEKPEAHPDNHPVISAFKANFIRGGLVLNTHFHHYANDVMGWAGFVEQLADNCYAIKNNTPFPAWGDDRFGISHFIKEEPPKESMVDGPPLPDRHPDHLGGATNYLFHLPKSKAAELKKLAWPDDGSWISSWDAFIAFFWRTTTRLRAPVFKPDPSSHLFWAESLDMRRRLHTPKCPPRMQGNVVFASLSPQSQVPKPTVAEVISEWPLSRLAQYVRQMTNEVTQERLDAVLNMVAPIKDKPSLMTRIDSTPPLSHLQTDHRDVKISESDFGFGKPSAYRHVQDVVSEGLTVVYPPRNRSPESDEGPELTIAYETSLAQELIDDPEWRKYFEYRGIDVVNAK